MISIEENSNIYFEMPFKVIQRLKRNYREIDKFLSSQTNFAVSSKTIFGIKKITVIIL